MSVTPESPFILNFNLTLKLCVIVDDDKQAQKRSLRN